MISGVPAVTVLLLLIISFIAGVGTTAIGPGGIFITIALYTLTDLHSAVVVGTASATFVGTGMMGVSAYVSSGELRPERNIKAGGILSVTGLSGALGGSWLNFFISEATFGILLSALISVTGVLVYYRSRKGVVGGISTSWPRHRFLLIGVIGGTVGISGGLFGVGGPVLAVPLLVAAGVPLLFAVGAAQLQSVFIAASATTGYALRGAVVWPLVAVISVPEIIGAVVGWRVAHIVDSSHLTRALGVAMIVLGPYIALH